MIRRKFGSPIEYRFNWLRSPRVRYSRYGRQALGLWNFLNVLLVEPRGTYSSGARWSVATGYLRRTR